MLGGTNASPAGEPITVAKSDYDAFERLLGDIQAAYSAEDLSALRAKVTPEMLSYFSERNCPRRSRMPGLGTSDNAITPSILPSTETASGVAPVIATRSAAA